MILVTEQELQVVSADNGDHHVLQRLPGTAHYSTAFDMRAGDVDQDGDNDLFYSAWTAGAGVNSFLGVMINQRP